MKYTIEGFSQEYACTLKKEVVEKGKPKVIQIDCTDLAILRWFTDFYPAMRKVIVDGKEYAFLSHQYLADDMPILDISRKGYIARMQKLVEFGLLDYELLKKDGNIPLYTFGKNYIHLVGDGNGTLSGSTRQPLDGQPSHPYPVNPPTLERSTRQPLDGQPANKNPSIINTSINPSIRGGEPAPGKSEDVIRMRGQFENVRLTDGEVERLARDYPAVYAQYIDKLSRYIKKYGDKYKDHCIVIEDWITEDAGKSKNDTGMSSFETGSFFEAALNRSYGG